MVKIYCVTYAGQTGVVKCYKKESAARKYAARRAKRENVPFDYGVQPCRLE